MTNEGIAVLVAIGGVIGSVVTKLIDHWTAGARNRTDQVLTVPQHYDKLVCTLQSEIKRLSGEVAELRAEVAELRKENTLLLEQLARQQYRPA